jgi:hypothetical protein
MTVDLVNQKVIRLMENRFRLKLTGSGGIA